MKRTHLFIPASQVWRNSNLFGVNIARITPFYLKNRWLATLCLILPLLIQRDVNSDRPLITVVMVPYTTGTRKIKDRHATAILKGRLHGGVQSTWQGMRPWGNKHCRVHCKVSTGPLRCPPDGSPQPVSGDAGRLRWKIRSSTLFSIWITEMHPKALLGSHSANVKE